MRWLFLCCILAVLLAAPGCTDRDKIPSNVIPKVKMEKVLWDMIQADRFSANFIAKDSTKNIKIETLKLYDQVFRINKISKDDFIKSFNFYLSRPDITKVMFDSLSVKASRKKAEMFQPITPAPKSQ